MVEERILKMLEDAEHAVWDAYVLLRDSKYEEYSKGFEKAWVEITFIVEEIRRVKDGRQIKGNKRRSTRGL